jgi:hypothetical protein
MMTWVVLVAVAFLKLAGQESRPSAKAPGGFEISGILVDADTGQPVKRARVAIAAVTQRNNFSTVITQEDGHFSFTGLVPGKYTLTAQARGYLRQSFNQHEQFSSSIVVGANLDSGNLTFRLAAEAAIAGVVTDEAGDPARDADVMLFVSGLSGGQQATRLSARASTNDEGAYHFGHLPPGRYLVAVATRPWYAQNQPRANLAATKDGIEAADPQADAQFDQLDVAYPVTFNGGVTDASQTAAIVLARGDKVTADVHLQPVPALHIRLPADEQAAYTVIEPRLFDGGVGVQNRGFRQGGNDVVSVPPGHYALRRFIDGGNSVADVREVDINSSGEIGKGQGSANVPLSAKLQVDAGTASGQVSVQLRSKKSGQVESERVDGNGEAVFKQGVAPGSYEISLSGPGIFVKSIAATGATITGRTIEIRPGNTVNLAVTAAYGEGQIQGTALRDGQRFAGAMIVLVPSDPAHNEVLFRRDQSDTDGTFTLPAVVPGAYTLLAIENGWDLEWMKPEVLKNYLGGGMAVEVQASGKYQVKLTVQ